MKTITSFTIDHMRLLPGLYVSRKDQIGREVITTFDIRITRPNFEDVLTTGEIHAIEHMAATFLRNHKDFGEKILYFGPMGCRTGFYLLLAGDYQSRDIVDLLIECFEFIKFYQDDIPGASDIECGNYKDMDQEKAIKTASNYLDKVLKDISEDRLHYPS